LLITPQGEAVARQFTTTDISDYFQDYGAAPQYLGFLLQSTNYMENPRLGQVLLSSALSPVPIIGKPFRQHSGNIIYGSLLGRGDQPVIFVGELLLDFSIFGVIGGFLTLGVCTSSMQNKYEISNEPFQTYAIQFASICFSYFIVCGIEEVSQLLLVFLWPVYFFLLYRIIKKKY